MRWFSAAFDAVCVLAVVILVFWSVDFYGTIDRNTVI